MCRILGAVGRKLDSPFIDNVFLESEHMGRDATGFWFPNTNIVKAPKKVSEFLPEVKDVFEEGINNSHIFLGHTRLATHGKPEFNYNNHPIESENWIVVHNGVVWISDIKNYPYRTDTDTENILAYIETFGLKKGLEYCSSGAAIILVNKNEENTLYTWRTSTSDMSLAYDIDRENVYISSGSRYFWAALKSEIQEIERLGGLFSVTGRRIKLVEPKGRELWKIYYKDDLVHAEKVADIPTKTAGAGFRTTYRYKDGYYVTETTATNSNKDSALFSPAGKGIHRPAIKEGRVKIHTTTVSDTTPAVTTTPKKITKTTETRFLDREVVKFRRKVCCTDYVTSINEGISTAITTEMEFIVQRTLIDKRIVLERAEDGAIFVAPSYLLELASPPSCLGICYNAAHEVCKGCIFTESCLDTLDTYKDIPKPTCFGRYESNDEECIQCTFLVPCISKLNRTDRLNRTDKRKDYIDAEFKEVNEAAKGTAA